MKSKSISKVRVPVGDRRGREPARGHVERDVPRVIDPGRQREADLADDLRPQVQGRVGVPPLVEREVGPGLRGARGASVAHAGRLYPRRPGRMPSVLSDLGRKVADWSSGCAQRGNECPPRGESCERPSWSRRPAWRRRSTLRRSLSVSTARSRRRRPTRPKRRRRSSRTCPGSRRCRPAGCGSPMASFSRTSPRARPWPRRRARSVSGSPPAELVLVEPSPGFTTATSRRGLRPDLVAHRQSELQGRFRLRQRRLRHQPVEPSLPGQLFLRIGPFERLLVLGIGPLRPGRQLRLGVLHGEHAAVHQRPRQHDARGHDPGRGVPPPRRNDPRQHRDRRRAPPAGDRRRHRQSDRGADAADRRRRGPAVSEPRRPFPGWLQPRRRGRLPGGRRNRGRARKPGRSVPLGAVRRPVRRRRAAAVRLLHGGDRRGRSERSRDHPLRGTGHPQVLGADRAHGAVASRLRVLPGVRVHQQRLPGRRRADVQRGVSVAVHARRGSRRCDRLRRARDPARGRQDEQLRKSLDRPQLRLRRRYGRARGSASLRGRSPDRQPRLRLRVAPHGQRHLRREPPAVLPGHGDGAHLRSGRRRCRVSLVQPEDHLPGRLLRAAPDAVGVARVPESFLRRLRPSHAEG